MAFMWKIVYGEEGALFTFGHDISFREVKEKIRPEHQQRIVDVGALPHLVGMLKRHKDGLNSRAASGVIRRAADAITNLAHENSSIKTHVRAERGIPPLVELLEFDDPKVQRAAAGALRTLAFKNDENKNQIVECNALPTLILMICSEDAAIHYEAVGVIGNLVHSSPNIKKEVLAAGALQPVISLLRSNCAESQREAALLIGQFAATDSDCKVAKYRDTYSHAINAVSTISKPVDICRDTLVIHPPLTKRPAGKPRVNRYKSRNEIKRAVKCSRCKKFGGHNRKSCKEII